VGCVEPWGLGGIVHIQIEQGKGRTEPCDTPACVSRGVTILLSILTLNFLFERNELISLVMLPENCNLQGQGAKKCQNFSDMQEHRSHSYVVEM